MADGLRYVAQLHAQTLPPGTKVCDLIDAQPRELHEAVLGGFMSALHGER
jgi:hypothetical protein